MSKQHAMEDDGATTVSSEELKKTSYSTLSEVNISKSGDSDPDHSIPIKRNVDPKIRSPTKKEHRPPSINGK